MMLAVSVLLAAARGFGPACTESHILNGTPKGGKHLVPANLKVAFLGDNNKDVFDLILEEGAELVVHAGDFDYYDRPDLFEEEINDALGPDFPYIASIGNHDVDAWQHSCGPTGAGGPGYVDLLYDRLVRTGMAAECSGAVGIDFTCSYKGLIFVGTAIGSCDLVNQPHVDYVNEAFSQWGSAWKMCHHHKNQNLYQTGGKDDETGYEILDVCRRHGAIVNTAHEHSYARTLEMSDFENFQYSRNADPILRHETPTQTATSFLFVSGLGGESIRGWDDGLQNSPWWAVTASADGCTGCGINRRTDYGVLFGVFNYGGNPNLAHFYFKDIRGDVFDVFNVTTTVPDTPTSITRNKCAAPWVEVGVSSSEDDVVVSTADLGESEADVTNGVIALVPGVRAQLVFRNIQLSNSSKFQGAWLQVYSNNAGFGNADIVMRAVHNGEQTNTVVHWTKDAEDWERHTVWVSANIKSLLEEIVAKPTWTAGDSIELLLENSGSARKFRTFDFGARYAPTLAYELVSPCA
eukprot:TRINITY_DN765_c0_g1_i1.p1 TRINITY_DN765_c0_g1~~TRINITY_DN765_c0_g1_i1.p1  ORF type:complete len:532 (-),score=133.20 TRINITY_DN765_c0_g1_i1:25-1587(-)